MKKLFISALCLAVAFGSFAGTVTITGSTCNDKGLLSTLSLSFTATTGPATIWFASDSVDRGEKIGNWKYFEYSASVGSGATSWVCPVGGLLKPGAKVMRAFIIEDRTDGLVELESVSSDGAEYVTTGFTPSGASRVVCDMKFDTLTSCALFGARIGANNNSFCLLHLTTNPNGGWRFDYADEIENTNHYPAKDRRYLIDMDASGFKVNGTTVYSRAGGVATVNPGCPLVVFGMNTAGTPGSPASITLYSLKAWSDRASPETLTSDLVPCRKADGTVGLLNRLTGGFQTNGGTGSLVAGAVKAHSTLGTRSDVSGVFHPYGTDRTLSVSRWYREGSWIAADLVLSSGHSDVSVVIAYGDEAGDGSLSSWDNLEILKQVPAADTAATVKMKVPKEIDYDTLRFRLFLVERYGNVGYDRVFDGIRATGTQYVITDFTPTSTSAVIADFTFDTVSETQVPFSARESSSKNQFCVLYTTAQGFRLDYADHIENSMKFIDAKKRFRLDMGPYLNVDGVRMATCPNEYRKTYTAGSPLTIFALNSAGAISAWSKAVCHSFVAWGISGNENTRMLNLLPCESNGEVGFYNRVDGKFYGNSGTGVFESVGESFNTDATVIALSNVLSAPPKPGLAVFVR